jgi:hypothetical protein
LVFAQCDFKISNVIGVPTHVVVGNANGTMKATSLFTYIPEILMFKIISDVVINSIAILATAEETVSIEKI